MRWQPNVTSNLDAGAGEETGNRWLEIQCVGMGAGDTLKVAGRPIGSTGAFQPLALVKRGTGAIIPGATGIVNDADVFEVDGGGLQIQLQYTKAVNNGDINWTETRT